DQLVDALENACVLSLKLYDEQHAPMNVQNGKIRFEEGAIDVFHLRVSEAGGTLSIERWVADDNAWMVQGSFANVSQTYFSFESLLAAAQQGITTHYNGVGNYRITYKVGDRSISELLEVVAAKVTPAIRIGEGKELLDFDTEKDGVFQRTTNNFKSNFLKFLPYGGIVTMVDSDGSSIESDPIPANFQLDFSDLLSKFGPGKYRFNYAIDGCTTFAEIEIVPELSITIVQDEKVLEEDTDGITTIAWGATNVVLQLAYPGGLVKVYDITEFGVLPGDLDDLGATRYYEDNVSQLPLDMQKTDIWTAGHLYEVMYSFGGETVSRRIHLSAPVIPVKSNITLWHGDQTLDVGAEIPIEQLGEYYFGFSPVGGMLTIRDEEGMTWANTEVEAEKVYLTDLLRIRQSMRLQADYQVEGAEKPASTWFTIIEPPREEKASLSLWQAENQMEDGATLLATELSRYQLMATPLGGRLVIIDDKGNELFNSELESESVSLLALPELEEGETLLKATYRLEGQEDNFATLSFIVVKALNPEKVTAVTVSLHGTDKLINQKEDRYQLKFDYQNPELAYELKFSQSPGSLNIRRKEETVLFMGVDEDFVLLRHSDIASGDYMVSYDAFEAEPIDFQLRVININPQFVLQSSTLEGEVYTAVFAPVRADGRSYVWRVDEKYLSSAKYPAFTFNFMEQEQFEVSLTMHYETYEATFSMLVTEELLNQTRDEQ
ncbi:MAG: hypothetical protein AAFO69_03695, partial [Bacteroidota bacterium]